MGLRVRVVEHYDDIGRDYASKFLSRRFWFAASYTAAGIAALYTGQLDGGDFVELAGIVLALYKLADFGDRWLSGR